MIDLPEDRRGKRNERRGSTARLAALTVAFVALLSLPPPPASAAGQPASRPADSTKAPRSVARNAGGLKAKGYLSARYAYVGSSSAATVYSGMQLTGSFQLSALSDRVVFKYRSHHWLNFTRPEKHVLESAFANRNIVHTGYVETNGLLARGLSARLGRFIPEMDYSSSPVIDGAALAYEIRGVTVGGEAGVMVDLWDGRETSNDILSSAHMKYRTDRVRLSAGYQSASWFDLRRREAPAGLNLMLAKFVWLETYAVYDFEFSEMTRAGAGLSWQGDRGSLSVAASEWRNPFDQLYLLDKSQSLVYSGTPSANAPATYRDVRLSGSFSGGGGWGARGSLSSLAGVRSGWMASAYLLTPSFFGFRANVGGQGMKSDFIKFYSLDAMVMKNVRDFSLQAQIQGRSYEWLSRPSGFYNKDAYSEVSAEYPLRRHLYLSAAAGGFIRTMGNEGFKPQVELRLIARI